MMTLLPAYGRDYKSRAAVEADFRANKDFLDADSGRLVNRPQITDAEVKFRYKRNTQTFVLRVRE